MQPIQRGLSASQQFNGIVVGASLPHGIEQGLGRATPLTPPNFLREKSSRVEFYGDRRPRTGHRRCQLRLYRD